MKIISSIFYKKWFNKLDKVIQIVILSNINKLEIDNFSKCAPVGNGIHELRIFFQKGYRIYFMNVDNTIVLLLCGGDKSLQQKDIKRAKEIKKFYDTGGNIL